MWSTIYIISLVIFWIALIGSNLFNKDLYKGISKAITVICLIVMSISLIYSSTQKYNSKRYNYKFEIKQTIINDSIVKADTFYVIMPKRK